MLQCSCGWRAHLGCLPQTSAWSRRVRPRLHPARLSPHLKMGWTMRCSFLIWHEQRWAPPGATHLAERSPAAPSGSCDGGGWRRACRLDTGGKNASNVREGGKRRNRWLWNIVAPLKWTALRQICLTLDTFSVPSLPPSCSSLPRPSAGVRFTLTSLPSVTETNVLIDFYNGKDAIKVTQQPRN